MRRYSNGRRIKRKNKKLALLRGTISSSNLVGTVQIEWASTKIPGPETSEGNSLNETVSPISFDSPQFTRALIGSCLSIRLFDRGTLWRWNLTRSTPQQVLSILSEDQSDIARFTPINTISNMPTLSELDVVEFPGVSPSASDYLIKWMAFDRNGKKDLFAFIGIETANKILDCAENADDANELVSLSHCLQGSLIMGAILTTRVDQMLNSMAYSLWTFLQVAHSKTHDTGFEKKLVWKLLNGLSMEGISNPVGLAQLIRFLELTLPGRMKREHKDMLLKYLTRILENRGKKQKKETKEKTVENIECWSDEEMERVEEEEITRVTCDMKDRGVQIGRKEKREGTTEEVVGEVVTSLVNDVVRGVTQGEKVSRYSIGINKTRSDQLSLSTAVDTIDIAHANQLTFFNTNRRRSVKKKAESITNDEKREETRSKMELRSAKRPKSEEKEKKGGRGRGRGRKKNENTKEDKDGDDDMMSVEEEDEGEKDKKNGITRRMVTRNNESRRKRTPSLSIIDITESRALMHTPPTTMRKPMTLRKKSRRIEEMEERDIRKEMEERDRLMELATKERQRLMEAMRLKLPTYAEIKKKKPLRRKAALERKNSDDDPDRLTELEERERQRNMANGPNRKRVRLTPEKSNSEVDDHPQPKRKRGRPAKDPAQKIMEMAQRMRKNILDEWDKEMGSGRVEREEGSVEMVCIDGERRPREKKPVKMYDPTPSTPKKRKTTIEKGAGNSQMAVDEPEVIQIDSSVDEENEEKKEKKKLLDDPDYKGFVKNVKKGTERVEDWVNSIDMAGVDPVNEDFPLPSQLIEAVTEQRTIAKKIPLWNGVPFQMPALINTDGVIDIVERTEEAVEGMIEDEMRMEEGEEGEGGRREEAIEEVCIPCWPMERHSSGHDHTYARREEEEEEEDEEEEVNDEIIDVVTVDDVNEMNKNAKKNEEVVNEKEKSNESKVAVDGFEMDDDVEEIHEIIEEEGGGYIDRNMD